MANLSDQKTLQNKSQVMGPTTIHLDTISDLDPVAYEGAFAYSSDKKMYFSNGSNWRTTEDPPIKTPNASAPTNDTTTQRQLILSGFLNSSKGTDYKQIAVSFEVSLSPSMKNPIMQKRIDTVKIINGVTTYPLINSYNLLATDTLPNLKPGDVFYWRGKYLATDGQESGFSKPYAQTFPAFIDTPKPLTGMNETTNSISVTAYHSPFGIDNLYPPYQIQWLLSTNADFSSAISITTDIATSNPLNTITIFPTPDTVYYWKARYSSTPASGRKFSEYSIPSFSKQVRDVGTPKNIVDTPQVLGATGKIVRLKITPYYSLTGKARATTEWLIATSADNLDKDTGITFTSDSTTSDSLEIVTLPLDTILADSKTIYYWKARYKNVLGTSSEYSPGATFVRYPEIVTPTATTVANIETKTLQASAFSSEYSTIYPYTLTEWRVYNAVTNTLVYSEDSASNSILNIFAHADVILPDGSYNWTIRYKNSRGSYSTVVSSTNSQIPWIYTPGPITAANDTSDQDSLTSSAFSSEYGVSPVNSEVTITALDGTLLEVIPNNSSPDKINVYSGLRGYSNKLHQGNIYRWKVKYTGYLNGVRVSKYSSTGTYRQPLFILAPTITNPISTDVTGRFEGPLITLVASTFATHSTVNNIGDEHISSDWQLSTTPTFDGWDDGTNRTIIARVDKNTNFTNTWTITSLLPATTYYARVRYYGNRGYSDWSQIITFSTLFEYKHFTTLPLNYRSNPVIGTGYAGGFFAGTMWQNIITTIPYIASNNYRVSAIVVGNIISFEVPSMQFNRIVYSGQTIQFRSTNSPRYIQVTGTVKTASATTLKILVTNIFIHNSMAADVVVTDWSVMAKFHTIISPKSSAGTITRIPLRDSYIQNKEISWIDFSLSDVDRTVLPNDEYLLQVTKPTSTELLDYPEDFFNLSDGQAIQTAMWRFSWLYYAWLCTTTTSTYTRASNAPDQMFPLAHAVNTLNRGTSTNPAIGINNYYDWYVPSRDELELCFYNLTPVDLGSGTSALFANYYYDPATYAPTPTGSYGARINSYVSVRGNISDEYPTLLDVPSTPVAAPEPNFGSNNNSEPVETSYYYTISNTINASPVTPYLKQTTAARARYYFPQANNALFAYNGTEALNGTYQFYSGSTLITATTSTVYSSTCIKSNTYYSGEYNNSDVIGGTTYKHPPYVLYVGRGLSDFGKAIGTYPYSTSPVVRLIRRQLA